MREIKFRAWDGEEMRLSPSADKYGLGGLARWFDAHSKDGLFIERERDSVVMQFTGLRDRNGAEIYEGDVIRCYDKSGEKVYDIEVTLPDFWQTIWSYNRHGVPAKLADKTLADVIGNVHQNPEMLTKNQ